MYTLNRLRRLNRIHAFMNRKNSPSHGYTYKLVSARLEWNESVRTLFNIQCRLSRGYNFRVLHTNKALTSLS